MPSVLFVCTGNTCRSPMAEALFKIQLHRAYQDLEFWRVESAGTWAHNGQPAASQAVQVMALRGANLSQHRSQRINAQLIKQFNLILTMESSHKDALVAEFPATAPRIFQLSQMSNRISDIADPIGKSTVDYTHTAHEIDDWIASGWETILKLS